MGRRRIAPAALHALHNFTWLPYEPTEDRRTRWHVHELTGPGGRAGVVIVSDAWNLDQGRLERTVVVNFRA